MTASPKACLCHEFCDAQQMTMLTRCAACHTAFRITTEQLVSRQGMVRCGKCSAVFNALDHLLPHPAAANASEQPGDADAPTAADGVAGSYDLFGAPTPPGPDVVDASRASAELPTSSVLLDPVEAAHAFRWWNLAGAVFAFLALCAQGAWFYRDQLAVLYPQTKPLLEAACAEIGCRIEPPTDAQAISIESSDLQADPANSGLLILSAVLRNRAVFAQSLPLLEITLTDALDMPLSRRVLKAPDYAPGNSSAGIGAGSELQLRIFVDPGQLKANGYRLYAFYP